MFFVIPENSSSESPRAEGDGCNGLHGNIGGKNSFSREGMRLVHNTSLSFLHFFPIHLPWYDINMYNTFFCILICVCHHIPYQHMLWAKRAKWYIGKLNSRPVYHIHIPPWSLYMRIRLKFLNEFTYYTNILMDLFFGQLAALKHVRL